ncbi:MAG: hypothetical protein II309_05465 [Bacilli bacterium]|nr:hypothetical protein [Bacilli bacterium]
MKRKECNHKTGYYTCKRLRLLEYLRKEGFLPYMTLPDVDNPKYNVWRFKNTPELEEAIDKYFKEMK